MKIKLNKEVCLKCSRRDSIDCGHFNVKCFNEEWERGFVYCYSKEKGGYHGMQKKTTVACSVVCHFYKKIDEARTFGKCKCKLEHIVLMQEELV